MLIDKNDACKTTYDALSSMPYFHHVACEKAVTTLNSLKNGILDDNVGKEKVASSGHGKTTKENYVENLHLQ